MIDHHYMSSMCDIDCGLLHEWKMLYSYKEGVVEKCSHCGEKQYIPENIPNDVYLSTHLKSALQPNDALFSRNYPNWKHI